MLFPPNQRSYLKPRVVVTGVGIITALGTGWKANAEGFRLGRYGFKPCSLFDVSKQRVQQAGQADLPEESPRTRLSRRHCDRMDRAGKLLLLASEQAWNQSQWSSSDSIPIVLGTTSGGMSLGEAFFRQAVESPESRKGQRSRVIHYQAQRQALDLADAFGFSGPVTIIANACASGANALGHAWELIRNGRAERVLTGGYDALSQLVFAGFDSLQALSTTQCRPFDAKRDGLSLGEGAAVFTLETLDSARRRHAKVFGEIVGYGVATDVHHLTQPHPAGEAAIASMTKACQAAGTTPDEIDYINAHGTGTSLNDSAEAAAINTWAGPRAATLPVSSIKSSIGHLLGAAGAVEAAVCLMALEGQWLPPTPTLEETDPVVKFPVVKEPASAQLDCVLTNSFGFGGANASLVLRRWTE